MDKNGAVSINAAINNAANYVAEGQLDQDTADMYLKIIEEALLVPGNDWKGTGVSVLLDDITIFLQDNGWYYDWREGGTWTD